jgi:tetratricopeptide (TPR) repeat protein
MMDAQVRPGLRVLIAIFLIVSVTLVVYYGTTRNGFVWDTVAYLYIHQQHISGLEMDQLGWMLTSLEMTNWHPVTWLSWAIDYRVFGGLNPWGYHISNNLLHSLNSVLVFLLTLVLFGLRQADKRSFPFRSDDKALLAAGVAALLFAVHPQHVESVAWVAERKDLLCQLFLLLTLLAYTRYVCCGTQKSARWYLATLALFGLALLSKPMAVTLPAVLLLMDVYPLRRTKLVDAAYGEIQTRSAGFLLLEKLPFLLLSAGLAWITLQAQQTAMVHMPFDLRLLNAFNSIILYLDKLLIPMSLSPFYPYSINPGEDIAWRAFVPVLGFLAITGLATDAWRRGHKAWLIAWLFYLVTLSPVLGLIQVGFQGAADRYAYFPTLPAYLLAGAGVLAVLQRAPRSMQALLALVVISAIFGLGTLTRQQIQVWQNEMSLWQHAASLHPRNVFIRSSLGLIYYRAGEYPLAVIHFEATGGIPMNRPDILVWRGLSYLRLERYEEALPDFVNLDNALQADPELNFDRSCIQYNVGWVLAQLQRPGEAADWFKMIETDTDPGRDAQTWLNQTQPFHPGALAGFCEDMIPITGMESAHPDDPGRKGRA